MHMSGGGQQPDVTWLDFCVTNNCWVIYLSDKIISSFPVQVEGARKAPWKVLESRSWVVPFPIPKRSHWRWPWGCLLFVPRDDETILITRSLQP